jgi:hypothetical protein
VESWQALADPLVGTSTPQIQQFLLDLLDGLLAVTRVFQANPAESADVPPNAGAI